MPDIGGLYNALRNDLATPLQALLVIMYHALAGVGIPSWGLTIILFTVLVKLVFWPLTVQQIKASRAMQSLQPQLAELKKQHGKDKEKLMAAQMELYKQNRVNPMAGCLPMLIQFPIWIGLYQALYSLAGTADFAGGFLWIPSLALPEGFPYLLAILTAASQFIVQRMMQVNTTDPQQKSMNQAMQFMPIMYLFISYRMPAGLVLYWVASNVFTLIQQSFYWGWSSAIPWRTAPAVALVPRQRREPVVSTPAEIAGPVPPVDAVVARSNGASSGVSSGAAPRRPKKRRK